MPELVKVDTAITTLRKVLGIDLDCSLVFIKVAACQGLMIKQLLYSFGERDRTVRRRLDRLRDKGLIEARVNPANKRARLLFLTPKAMEALSCI